jgi:hypothetical protein
MEVLTSAAPSKGGSANERSRPAKVARKRWTEEQTATMLAAIATAPSYAAAAVELGLTLKVVTARIHTLRMAGDPRLSPIKRRGLACIPVPADFLEHASAQNAELTARYDVSKSTVTRWRKETNTRKRDVARPRPVGVPYKPLPVPDNFVALAPTMRMHEAGIFWGVGPRPLYRWARKVGVSFRRIKQIGNRQNSMPTDRAAHRDMSNAGQAADHLRRYGPVFRCTADGKPDTKGTHWHRGSFVLTDEDIIDRAQRNGWDADAWRKIAA